MFTHFGRGSQYTCICNAIKGTYYVDLFRLTTRTSNTKRSYVS